MHHNYIQGKNYEVLKLFINKAKICFQKHQLFLILLKILKFIGIKELLL